MKKILKSATPASLMAVRLKLKGKNWDYMHEHYRDVYIELMETALCDQGRECAYTGEPLSGKARNKAHIDHFRKKGMYPTLTFDWQNMFAAVKDEPYGAHHKDKNIRDKKENEKLLNPLTDDVERYFYYSTDGRVEPAASLDATERERAKHAIDIFNLNCPRLVNRRSQAMDQYRYIVECVSPDEYPDYTQSIGFSFLLYFEAAQRT